MHTRGKTGYSAPPKWVSVKPYERNPRRKTLGILGLITPLMLYVALTVPAIAAAAAILAVALAWATLFAWPKHAKG